jgi:hypothetical protein
MDSDPWDATLRRTAVDRRARAKNSRHADHGNRRTLRSPTQALLIGTPLNSMPLT